MKKVLLIQDVISSYRVPVYNIIAERYDLTVLYSTGKVPENVAFNVILHDKKRVGPFYSYGNGFSNILKKFDIILFQLNPFEISLIWNIIKAKITKKQKFIPWGIGVPASYSVRYDDPSKQRSVKLTKHLIIISDAVIFYTEYPVNKYAKMGIDKCKMFVAHNTVEVLPLLGNKTKNSILFVGTLYKAKSSMNMLEYYKNAYQKNKQIPKLRIVGGGDEFEDIIKWVKQNQLQENILLEGAVFDEKKLRGFFEEAYACVSLGQAGLSVQKAMGYGVPFVTTENSFTGGERLDIINRENGLLLKEEKMFEDVILEIASSPDSYLKMGDNALSFYKNNRTVQMMANAVCDAIESVK